MARAKRRRSNEAVTDVEGETEAVTHDAMERTRRQAHRAQLGAFDAFDLFNEPMAHLLDRNWAMFQKTLYAMQAESLRFMNRRLEHTTNVIEHSRDCEGISDFLAMQQDWMVEFARDYAEQTSRFAGLIRNFAESGASTLSDTSVEVAERGRREAEHYRRNAD